MESDPDKWKQKQNKLIEERKCLNTPFNYSIQIVCSITLFKYPVRTVESADDLRKDSFFKKGSHFVK